MTNQEIQEQAEKILQEYKGDSCYIHEDDAIGAMNDLVKWMQEQDKWIEIKSKDDLPKNENYGLYHVITKEVKYCDEPQNQGIEEYWEKDAQKDKWWLDNVIWYQPIIKPSPPKTK